MTTLLVILAYYNFSVGKNQAVNSESKIFGPNTKVAIIGLCLIVIIVRYHKIGQMEQKELDILFEKFAKSKFRSRFKLSRKDLQYFEQKGFETIEQHALDFVSKRLGPAYPENDGKQTPMKNHPVFVAQHATATCCRKCLQKWHKIPKGKELIHREIGYIVSIIMHWIILSMKGNIRYNLQVDEDT